MGGASKTLVVVNALIFIAAVATLMSPRIRRFSYTAFITAAVSIALSFPQYFVSIRGFGLQHLIVPLLQIITFGVGCTMGWRDFLGVWKMPKSVAIGVVCHYAIMPLVALLITELFRFPPEIAAGVILVGCCPSGLASNVIAYMAKANLALSITITAISTLLAPLFTPLLMKVLAGQFVHVSVGAMAVDILKIIIGPVIAGAAFHKLFGRRAAFVLRVMPLISMLGVALIIVVISAQGREALLRVGAALIAAMFLHMTAGFLLGYAGGRLLGLAEADCRTISIEVGMQNGGLASGIAVSMGKIATVGLAAAVNGPVMNTTFSLLGTWWSHRPPGSESNNS